MKQRHEWAKRLSWLLLLLILVLTFGWRVAAVLLVLWTIGYVAFWLFMLLKPVKQDYLLPQPRGDEPPPGIRQELGGRSEKASLGKIRTSRLGCAPSAMSAPSPNGADPAGKPKSISLCGLRSLS